MIAFALPLCSKDEIVADTFDVEGVVVGMVVDIVDVLVDVVVDVVVVEETSAKFIPVALLATRYPFCGVGV
jgi:hypothetical protein